MNRISVVRLVATVLVASLSGMSMRAVAQGTQPAGQESARPAPIASTQLKVDVVINRYKGETKTSSLPFMLWVNVGPFRAEIHMGVDVAVPQSAGSFQYRKVGTNISCSAQGVDTRYMLDLQIEDSSIYRPEQAQGAASVTLGDYPAFRSFSSNTRPVLRDGQTVQFTMATDKVTAEVIKVDVTATVVK